MMLGKLKELSIIKTLRYNLHYFGVRGFRFPVLVSRNFVLPRLGGVASLMISDLAASVWVFRASAFSTSVMIAVSGNAMARSNSRAKLVWGRELKYLWAPMAALLSATISA